MKVFIERRIRRIEQKIEDLKAEKLPDHPVYRGKYYDIGYWEGALSAYETMLDRVTEEDAVENIDFRIEYQGFHGVGLDRPTIHTNGHGHGFTEKEEKEILRKLREGYGLEGK